MLICLFYIDTYKTKLQMMQNFLLNKIYPSKKKNLNYTSPKYLLGDFDEFVEG